MSRLRRAGRFLADLAVTIAVHLGLARWPGDPPERTKTPARQ